MEQQLKMTRYHAWVAPLSYSPAGKLNTGRTVAKYFFGRGTEKNAGKISAAFGTPSQQDLRFQPLPPGLAHETAHRS